MTPVVSALLANAVVVAILAPLVWFVARSLRRPAVSHALWLLLLAKLVVLPLVEFPLGGLLAAPAIPTLQVPVMPTSELPPVLVDFRPALASVTAPVAPSVGLDTLLLGCWLLGSIVVLAWLTLRHVRFVCLLRRVARPAPQLSTRTATLARRLGLRRAPRVQLVAAAISPMLWGGALRPAVLMPERLWRDHNGDELDSLLVHELAHYRRRDHWTRWLELVALIAFWWHPALWLLRRELHEAEEACCDAWVVEVLPGAKRAYADALLDVVDFLSLATRRLPVGASGIGHIKSLRKRLTMIMKQNVLHRMSLRTRCSFLAMAALLLPIVPTFAQRPTKQHHHAKQAKKEEAKRRVEKGVKKLKQASNSLEAALDRLRLARKRVEARGDLAKVRDARREIRKTSEKLAAVRAELEHRLARQQASGRREVEEIEEIVEEPEEVVEEEVEREVRPRLSPLERVVRLMKERKARGATQHSDQKQAIDLALQALAKHGETGIALRLRAALKSAAGGGNTAAKERELVRQVSIRRLEQRLRMLSAMLADTRAELRRLRRSGTR